MKIIDLLILWETIVVVLIKKHQFLKELDI